MAKQFFITIVLLLCAFHTAQSQDAAPEPTACNAGLTATATTAEIIDTRFTAQATSTKIPKHRHFWRSAQTYGLFFGTMIALNGTAYYLGLLNNPPAKIAAATLSQIAFVAIAFGAPISEWFQSKFTRQGHVVRTEKNPYEREPTTPNAYFESFFRTNRAEYSNAAGFVAGTGLNLRKGLKINFYAARQAWINYKDWRIKDELHEKAIIELLFAIDQIVDAAIGTRIFAGFLPPTEEKIIANAVRTAFTNTIRDMGQLSELQGLIPAILDQIQAMDEDCQKNPTLRVYYERLLQTWFTPNL